MVALAELQEQQDLILEVFSNLNNSMFILWHTPQDTIVSYITYITFNTLNVCLMCVIF